MVLLYSFFSLGARWGWVIITTPRLLYPRERPGAHCMGGKVSTRLSGRVQKISPPLGFNPWTLQPIAIHYRDYTVVAHGAITVDTES